MPHIRRKDFLIFAETIGLNKKSAEKMIAKITKLKDKYIVMCNESYMKKMLVSLIEKRVEILAG